MTSTGHTENSAPVRKVAVVLLNLGGPDSKNAIRPFLMNFFMDPNIIRLPVPLRCLIAWAIARRRSRKEAKDSYGELGGASPLLANSRAQALALEAALNARAKGIGEYKTAEYKTFVCMRYWHPMSAQVVREVRDWGAQEIVLLPLYPQFSTTTTWSSLGVWKKAAHEAGYEVPTRAICCYPRQEGFIEASAASILDRWNEARAAGHEKIRILFSAHGLPESVIRDGDPYQWQCEETARLIAERLGERLALPGLDWLVSYQSRVGPQKWIGPATEAELERAARDKTAVIIYPHAFTQEHVETLVELDIEYRHKAEANGIPGYFVARTAGTHPAFIGGLADMVIAAPGMASQTTSSENRAICPERFDRCCQRAIYAAAKCC